MALSLDDTEEFGPAAPEPLPDEAYEEGDFQRLWPTQGAVSALRMERERHSGRRSVGTLVLTVAVSLAAIVGIVSLVLHMLDRPIPTIEELGEAEQVVAGASDTVTYRGATYGMVETTNGYALAELHEDDQFVPLGEVVGEPAALVLYDGALVIPENLEDGTWDVVAYTIGSGWSAIMDASGSAQAGEGAISDVSLEDSTLRLTVGDQTVEIALAW